MMVKRLLKSPWPYVGIVVVVALVLPWSLNAWTTWSNDRAVAGAAQAHRDNARTALEAGDFRQAELALRAALDLDPRHPPTRRQLMRVQALWAAKAPESLDGRDLEALIYSLTVLGAYDKSASEAGIYIAAGIVAQRRQRNTEALELYTQAVAVEPANAEAHLALGALHRRQGRAPEALASYEAAFAADPTSLKAANDLGVHYVDLGRLEEGVEMFQKALALSDNLSSRINLGNALTGLGRIPEALEHLGQATKLAPASPQSWSRLGGALFEAKRYQDARTALNRSLGLKRDAETVMHLAQTYQALGRHDVAAKLLQEVMQSDPGLPRLAYHLAVSLEALGDQAGAIVAYEKHIERAGGPSGGDPTVKQAQARLSDLRKK